MFYCAWRHTKSPFNFFKFFVFKYLNFIAFGNRALLANKVHRASFKLFQLKNVPLFKNVPSHS